MRPGLAPSLELCMTCDILFISVSEINFILLFILVGA